MGAFIGVAAPGGRVLDSNWGYPRPIDDEPWRAIAWETATIVVDPGWPKAMRFALIGGTSLLASVIALRLARALRRFLILIVGFAVITAALYLLWRIS